MSIRLAIIGLGDMGLGHVRGFERLEGCEIAVLCDENTENLEWGRKSLIKSKPKFLTDYKEIIKDPSVDAVVVAVPNFLHRQIALDVLSVGKDLFLEKPVATTVEECDEIILAVLSTKCIIQIGLVYRYANLYRTIAQLVESGTFGNVMMMYCKEYRENFPSPWFFDKKKSGGAILDKNCHHFDLFNWYIRSKPVRVYAMGGQHVVKGENYQIQCSYAARKGLTVNNPTILDHAFVLVEYENGAKANLGLCMYEKEPVEGLEVGLMGDNGAHAVARKDISLVMGGGPLGEMQEVPVDYESDNQGVGHIGCQTERKEFLECLRSRKEPYASLFVGRDSTVISLAAEKSIEENRVVLISEFDNPKIEPYLSKRAFQYPLPSPAPLPPKAVQRAAVKPVTFLNPQLFIERLNRFPELQKALRDLNADMRIFLPEGEPITLRISNSSFSLGELSQSVDVSLQFTQEGWTELLSGGSLQKLFGDRKLLVEGDLQKILPYVDAFLLLGEALKAE